MLSLLKFLLVLCVVFINGSLAAEPSLRKEGFDFVLSLNHCLQNKGMVDCVKRKVIDKLDQQLKSNRTIEITDSISISKDPQWKANSVANSQRSSKGMSLNDILATKVNEYIASLIIQFKMNDNIENNVGEVRGKKQNKNMQMVMYGAIGLFGILSQLFIGKLAIVSAAALMIAKIALLLSLLSALKKLSSSGGSENHIVYTTEHVSPHSGGWSRSTVAQDMAYRGQRRPNMEMIPSMGYSVYEEPMKGEMDPSGK